MYRTTYSPRSIRSFHCSQQYHSFAFFVKINFHLFLFASEFEILLAATKPRLQGSLGQAGFPRMESNEEFQPLCWNSQVYAISARVMLVKIQRADLEEIPYHIILVC